MNIIGHPNQIRKLKEELKKHTQSSASSTSAFMGMSINFIEQPYMEEFRKTGKYILPNNLRAEKHQVKIHTRFIDYGPEDLEWLLYSGLVTEEEVPNILQMKEYRGFSDFNKPLPLFTRKTF